MHELHTSTGAAIPLLGWAGTGRLNPYRLLPLLADECYPAKPAGGLWTSPLDGTGARTAWMRWCRAERHDRTFTTLTVIRVAAKARVLVIDGDTDVRALDRRYGRGEPEVPPMTPAVAAAGISQSDWEELNTQRVFDWPAIAGDFDAVYLTENGLNSGGGVVPRLRWDVPTVWLPHPAFHIEGVVAVGPNTLRRPAWAWRHGRIRYVRSARTVDSRRPS
jgi:hypothetical protein